MRIELCQRRGVIRRILAMAIAVSTVAIVTRSHHAHAATVVETAEAEELARRATGAFKAGLFDEAARLFMRAYGKSSKAALVFNAARAYEQAGNLGEAIALFRLYLSISKDPDGIADAHLRMRALEAKQLERHGTPPVNKPVPTPVTAPPPPSQSPGEPSSSPPARSETPEAGPTVVREHGPATQPQVAHLPMPPTPVSRETPSHVVAWTVTTLGLGLSLAGGFLLVAGASDSEAANTMPNRDMREYASYSKAWDDAERKWQLGAVALVAGAATGGAAIWMYLREPDSAVASTGWQGLVPVYLDGRAGAMWRAAW